MILNIKKKLKNCINDSLEVANEENCTRNRKILFSDMYYFINLYNSN